MKFRLKNIPQGAADIKADAGTNGPTDLKTWAARASYDGHTVYAVDEDSVSVYLDLASAGESSAWEGQKYTADCLHVECDATDPTDAAREFTLLFTAKEKDEQTAVEHFEAAFSGRYAGEPTPHFRVKVARKNPAVLATREGLFEFVPADLYITPPNFSPHVAIHVPFEVGSKAENWEAGP